MSVDEKDESPAPPESTPENVAQLPDISPDQSGTDTEGQEAPPAELSDEARAEAEGKKSPPAKKKEKTFLQTIFEQHRVATRHLVGSIDEQSTEIAKQLEKISEHKFSLARSGRAYFRAMSAVNAALRAIRQDAVVHEHEEFGTDTEMMNRFMKYTAVVESSIRKDVGTKLDQYTTAINRDVAEMAMVKAMMIDISHSLRCLIYVLCEQGVFSLHGEDADNPAPPKEKDHLFELNWSNYHEKLSPAAQAKRVGMLSQKGPEGERVLIGGLRTRLFGYQALQESA